MSDGKRSYFVGRIRSDDVQGQIVEAHSAAEAAKAAWNHYDHSKEPQRVSVFPADDIENFLITTNRRETRTPDAYEIAYDLVLSNEQ